MRREHTYTSPDHLYQIKNTHKSPYLSPKHRQMYNQSFKSPSSHHQMHLQNKFPHSNKYISYNQQQNHHPRNTYLPKNNYEQSYDQSMDRNLQIQISELRLTISQLRVSLQSSTETSQRLQEELYSQKSRSIEVKEMNRRLQQELKRMEFQLERIGNYDTLQHRQISVKLENNIRQNSRLSNQVNDFVEQIKGLKTYQRKIMTQCEMLLKEKQVLMVQNQNLLQKLRQVEMEVRQVKHDVALQRQQNSFIAEQNQLASRINNIPTGRSNNSPTFIGSNHAIISKQSIQIDQLPQDIDYEYENRRLAENYEKLLSENESMKKLYIQFYKNDKEKSQISKKSKKIIQDSDDQKYSRSFSNKVIEQSLNSHRIKEEDDENLKMMLQTRQRNEIIDEYNQVKQQSLAEIIKCYMKSLKKSQNKQANSLKIFTEEIIKNKHIYGRMAENYLKMREAIKQQTGIKLPLALKESQLKTEKQLLIANIFKNTKQKARGQGDLGLSLAIFRLLTLLIKSKELNQVILDNIKHSALKYTYKISQAAGKQ